MAVEIREASIQQHSTVLQFRPHEVLRAYLDNPGIPSCRSVTASGIKTIIGRRCAMRHLPGPRPPLGIEAPHGLTDVVDRDGGCLGSRAGRFVDALPHARPARPRGPQSRVGRRARFRRLAACCLASASAADRYDSDPTCKGRN